MVKCIEPGCEKKATKKYKGPDGLKLRLCAEHYKKYAAVGKSVS